MGFWSTWRERCMSLCNVIILNHGQSFTSAKDLPIAETGLHWQSSSVNDFDSTTFDVDTNKVRDAWWGTVLVWFVRLSLHTKPNMGRRVLLRKSTWAVSNRVQQSIRLVSLGLNSDPSYSLSSFVWIHSLRIETSPYPTTSTHPTKYPSRPVRIQTSAYPTKCVSNQVRFQSSAYPTKSLSKQVPIQPSAYPSKSNAISKPWIISRLKCIQSQVQYKLDQESLLLKLVIFLHMRLRDFLT